MTLNQKTKSPRFISCVSKARKQKTSLIFVWPISSPGYPACPDHTEKETLFELRRAPEAGLILTDSFAMLPASSVSGYYFSHPQSHYFGLGKITDDQVKDYARRKGQTEEYVRKWLGPNIEG